MRQKRQAFALLGALLAAAGPTAGGEAAWTERLERWLFNPRERTLHAKAAGLRGDVEESAAALETALRLAPDDPAVQYNAGTARLATGGDAAPLLESAARLGDGVVAPRAFYNLGNARMGAGDLPGAVEAYRQTLRRAPADADAKFNLELAQRLLEEQRRPPPPEEQEPPQQQQDSQPEPQQPPPQDEQQSPEPERDDGGQRPLPQFRDLPDMTAEEAAAILEAVENMERERRREEAREASRSRARTEKDW